MWSVFFLIALQLITILIKEYIHNKFVYTDCAEEMFKKFLNMDVNQIYTPVGCPECSGGYRGRIAIQEVLLISPDIRDAINAKITKAELRELVYNSDVISLLQDGLYKVLAGFTSIEEIIKLTESEDEINAETKIKGMLKRMNANNNLNVNNSNNTNTNMNTNNNVNLNTNNIS